MNGGRNEFSIDERGDQLAGGPSPRPAFESHGLDMSLRPKSLHNLAVEKANSKEAELLPSQTSWGYGKSRQKVLESRMGG